MHGLYWLSANVALEAPLLAVDDAHWVDDASIAFLSFLARRVDELRIVVVYCSRVGEGASDSLSQVTASASSSTTLRPRALSAEATAAFATQALGAVVSPGFARACHVTSLGNPFLLGELLRTLQEDGIVPDDSGAVRVEHLAPRAVARATLARLRRLGPRASARPASGPADASWWARGAGSPLAVR